MPRAAKFTAPTLSDREVLSARAKAWQDRPLLRQIYTGYFQDMVDNLTVRSPSGRRPHGWVVEIGGGSGHFRSLYPHAIVTDLIDNPYIDIAVDALRLPFADASIDNLVMQDVLHHLPFPLTFLSEAQRVLAPGGRIVMIEPFISPVSHVGYRVAHFEPVDMTTAIFGPASLDDTAHPAAFQPAGAFASNQAIPTLLFFRRLTEFQSRFPQLMLKRRDLHSLIVYPLSGGFSGPVLLPAFAVGVVKQLEKILSPLSRLMAFRMLVVLEKSE